MRQCLPPDREPCRAAEGRRQGGHSQHREPLPADRDGHGEQRLCAHRCSVRGVSDLRARLSPRCAIGGNRPQLFCGAIPDVGPRLFPGGNGDDPGPAGLVCDPQGGGAGLPAYCSDHRLPESHAEHHVQGACGDRQDGGSQGYCCRAGDPLHLPHLFSQHRGVRPAGPGASQDGGGCRPLLRPSLADGHPDGPRIGLLPDDRGISGGCHRERGPSEDGGAEGSGVGRRLKREQLPLCGHAAGQGHAVWLPGGAAGAYGDRQSRRPGRAQLPAGPVRFHYAAQRGADPAAPGNGGRGDHQHQL